MKVARLNIVVDFEYEDTEIAASSGSNIHPLMLPNGAIDRIALGEYEDFVLEAYAVLERNGFEELKPMYESNVENSASRYFTMYKPADSAETDIKCVTYIRVSDHPLNKSRLKFANRYYSDETRRLENCTKKILHWKLRFVVVNREMVDSYEDAIEYLQKVIPKW